MVRFFKILQTVLANIYLKIRFRSEADADYYLRNKWGGRIEVLGGEVLTKTVMVIFGVLVLCIIVTTIVEKVSR